MADGELGRVVFDVGFDVSMLRKQVQTVIAEPFEATVAFNPAQIKKAFNTAVAAANLGPVIVDVEYRTDKDGLKRVASQATATQKQISASQLAIWKAEGVAQARELAKRNTQSRKFYLQDSTNFKKYQQTKDVLRTKAEQSEAAALERADRQRTQFRNRDILNERQHQRILERMQLRRPTNFAQVTAGLERTSKSLQNFDRLTSNVLRSSLTAFNVWSAGVALAVGVAATAGVVAYANLEQASIRAGAVVANQKISEEILATGKAVSDFSKLTADARKQIDAVAKQTALTTLFNPKEAITGIRSLLQAGQTQEQAFKSIGAAAKFAQVNEIELTEATDGLASALAASGEAASYSTKLLDQISFTAANALGEASDYLQSFANGAEAAGQAFGYSTEEVLTLLGLIGQAGTVGLEAGTQARIVLRELGRGAGRAAEAWKQYGIDANGSLNEQLVRIGQLATAVQKQKGRAGVAGLAEELGLTYRSLNSILLILPQINKQGIAGLDAQTKAITNASGVVENQSKELSRSIAFQWDNLLDTLNIAFAEFGQAASEEVTALFDAFAGPGGLIQQATPAIQAFGRAFGRLIGDLADFVQTDAFASGILTLVQSVEITLKGVGAAFSAFSQAFGVAAEGRSAFESFALAVKGFAQLSAQFLPVVAKLFGEVFGFIIQHPEAFEFFAKAAAGLFLLNKALSIVIVPALRIAGVLGSIAGFASSLPIGLAGLSGIVAGIAGVFVIAAGAVSGFVTEIRNAVTNDPQLMADLRIIGDLLSFVGKAIKEITILLYDFGRVVGQSIGVVAVGAVKTLGSALRILKGDFKSVDSDLRRLGGAAKIASGALSGNLIPAADAINSKLRQMRGEAAATGAELEGFLGSFGSGFNTLLQRSRANNFESGKERRAQQARIDAWAKSRIAANKKVAAARKQAVAGVGLDEDEFDFSGSDLGGSGSIPKLRDLSAEAAEAIDKLTAAQRKQQGLTLVDRVKKLGEGYQLTRREAALLERTMPLVDKQLENQRKLVESLDKALQDLRSTQIAGTKAFSDAAFANDQAIKRLQLSRLDLLGAGNAEDSSPVTALDDQIKALQSQNERQSLVESLQLDPLRRKLDETFSPVKELPFDQIIKQFSSLSADQAKQSAELSRQEGIQKLLTASLQASNDQYSRMDAAAQRAVQSTGAVASGFSGIASSAQDATSGLKDFDTAATGLDDSGKIVDDAAVGVAKRTTELAPKFRAAGSAVSRAFAGGMIAGAQAYTYPAARAIGLGISAILASPPVTMPANAAGITVMRSFLVGMQTYFDETIAPWLNKTVPERIRDLKGPVEYDATILVPAGEAVMQGFDRGLRSGFGTVESFLRGVGPSMEEYVPESVFIKRTANFMYEVSKGNTPDPSKFFGDLMPAGMAEYSGALDPSLSFLHRTESLADTQGMAAHLAKLFGLTVTSTDRAAGTLTSSGNVSDHTFGTAADISGSVANTDRLVAAVGPLFGSIFKQIIWHNRDVNRGYHIPDHEDHAHLAWLMGKEFAKASGKIGAPAMWDIPGASPTVDQAINAAARATGVDVRLLAAIAKQESGFNPRVFSPAGAGGLFQLMPGTAAGLGVFNILDPMANALGGAKYIKQQLKSFGSLDLALAAYNAGPGNAHRALQSFSETINYVARIKGFLQSFGGSMKPFGGFRAAGGDVLSSRSYIVGERGPELFTPKSAGTILPADITKAMQSGQGGNITYSPTYNMKSNARDNRAVADYMDLHTRRRLGAVIR